MATIISTGGGTPDKTPDYATKLIVHVATSDNGSVGDTRVRIRNEQLGANYTRSLDSLGNATFEILENRTYYVILLDYPSKYYGGAALVTAGSGQIQEITITLKTDPDILGWRMNESNGEIEYTDGATDWLPASMGERFDSGSWGDSWLFRNIRPCMLKNGVVQYYLNPNDYSKKTDGTNADITSGNDGDVMIEFPLVYYKFYSETGPDGITYSGCKFTLVPPDDTYCANAFLSETGVVQQTMYMSAYEGISYQSKLRSISGVTPTKVSLISNRNLAAANGKGYQLHEWNKRVLLQSLFVLMFRGTDSKSLLGKGKASPAVNTGTLNAKGMYSGDLDGVKFCGIEHFWGNGGKYCDGVYLKSSYFYYKIHAPYGDIESNHMSVAASVTFDGYHQINKMTMNNGYGMLPKNTLSSGTGYFYDTGYYKKDNNNKYPMVGTADRGIFFTDFDYTASGSGYATYLSYTPQGG